MIIRTSRELKAHYHRLEAGDIFIGTLAYRHLKKTVIIDLLERGVICLPSATAQCLNGSKVAQALILGTYMLPHTTVAARRADLLEAINRYNQLGIKAVVSKEDHMHCGHGIRRWDHIETLYSFLALSESSYPFVLQPLLQNFSDVRAIIIGDYVEAYRRHNPGNFRMNLAAGGRHTPYTLSPDQENFCRDVMARGKFPYAHIDLQITDQDEIFLSEIALTAGAKGACISRPELDRKKQTLLEHLASRLYLSAPNTQKAKTPEEEF